MNRIIKVGVAALALAAVVPAFADEIETDEEEGAVGWTPIAFGIASPVQLPWGHARWDVFGLDLNVLYSGAPKMYGLGIGGLCMLSTDEAAGLELSALCNYNAKDFSGIRVSPGANIVRGTAYGLDVGGFGYRKAMWGIDVEFIGSLQDDFTGWQIGGLANVTKNQSYGWELAIGVNIADKAYGCQTAAIFNMAQELHGCQIACVNFAETCPWGFQIGLVNIIMDNSLKVLPLVNGYF